MIDPTRVGGPALPPLEAFRQGAEKGEAVQVTIDGQDFKVVAQGQMQGAGSGARSVAWVQGEADSTGMFVQALSQSFGHGLSSAVARELGLDPSPGKPLASRAVMQALDMAAIGQQALAGVDFLTRLEHSANAKGAAFEHVASSIGIDPARLTGDQRAAIDAGMQARFDAASAQGQSPVAHETAAAWLRDELAAHAGPQT